MILSGSAEEYEREPLSVGAFLDVLNESFVGMRIALRGEISSIEERRNVWYFSLKDSTEESMLSCIMFRNDFLLNGEILEEGQEVIVEGVPNIWKPRGKLSFLVSVVRLAGAGALKRAYDTLRATLDREGIFSPEKKRAIPVFPRRIALITSREGAALGDFAANLGRYGFSVTLFDAHVEGKRAIGDILEGIAFFDQHPDDWDVLVIIRGGGSLESLEAFNSERIVRAIAASRIPTLAGIGHEKDVSLAALAADSMVSTPTATAKVLSASGEEIRRRVAVCSESLFGVFREMLFDTAERIQDRSNCVRHAFERLLMPIRNADRMGIRIASSFSAWCKETKNTQTYLSRAILQSVDTASFRKQLETLEFRIAASNPQRLLERGYGIVRKNRVVVRKASDVTLGSELDVLLASGTLQVHVTGKSEG